MVAVVFLEREGSMIDTGVEEIPVSLQAVYPLGLPFVEKKE